MKVNPNVEDKNGMRPIMVTLSLPDRNAANAAMQMLLEHKADPNASAKNGPFLVTPLLVAISKNNAEAVDMLLANGANPDLGDPISPLMRAAQVRDAATVEKLIKAGADVNKKQLYGGTPLQGAASVACPAVIDLLLKAGADANATDDGGDTPLTNAAVGTNITTDLDDAMAGRSAYGRVPSLINAEEAVSLLVKAGADVNRANAKGRTPLIIAALAADPGMCRLLLSLGADKSAKDATGRTAADYAALTEEERLAEMYPLFPGAEKNEKLRKIITTAVQDNARGEECSTILNAH